MENCIFRVADFWYQHVNMRISIFYLTALGYKKLQKNFCGCHIDCQWVKFDIIFNSTIKAFYCQILFLLAVSSRLSVSANG